MFSRLDPSRGLRRARFPLFMTAVLMATAGCGAPTPSLTPSPTPLVPPSVAPGPATPDPSAPSADPTPVPLPTTETGWSHVPAQASLAGVQLQRLVWTGTRFVGLGVARETAGTAILDSADGLTWHRQSTFGVDMLPAALAAGPHGVLAVVARDNQFSVWTSPDGLTWTIRDDAFPGPQLVAPDADPTSFTVNDVVASDAGWLAVGRVDPVCQLDCGVDPVRPLVWTSTDGVTWTTVAANSPHRGMNAVARGGEGYVAVGVGRSGAAAWTSRDGSTWSPAPDAPVLGPRSGAEPSSWIAMTDVAATDGTIVAVGMDQGQPGGDLSIRAWWSSDGRTWADATGDAFAGGQAFAVTATPRGFLLMGPSTTSRCLGGLWESPDGRTWTCVANEGAFGGFGPDAAAASPSVVVAVGLDASGPESDEGVPGTAWIKPIR